MEYLFAFVDTYYLVQVHRMAYTRSGMTSAPYREYRAPLSAVVALVAMFVYVSSATGRFPRALLYEEVFHAWCVRELVFACCMPEEQQKRFHQAQSYEHVCPVRDVSTIVRSAVWKTND